MHASTFRESSVLNWITDVPAGERTGEARIDDVAAGERQSIVQGARLGAQIAGWNSQDLKVVGKLQSRQSVAGQVVFRFQKEIHFGQRCRIFKAPNVCQQGFGNLGLSQQWDQERESRGPDRQMRLSAATAMLFHGLQ